MCNKRYFPGPAAFFSVGPDNYIVYNFSTGNVFRLSAEDAFRYSQLHGIKTKDFYKSELTENNDPLQDTGKEEKLLSDFIKSALLVPLADPSDKTIPENTGKYSIVSITSERPDLLSLSLKSISEGIHEKHTDIAVTVFDDSDNDQNKLKNKNTVSEINKKYRLKTHYFGEKEKELFINNLAHLTDKHGIERKILDFAVFSSPEYRYIKGPGGNRNASLLRFAGNKIISFDDDIKYIFKTAAEIHNCLEISYLKDPDKDLYTDIKKINSSLKSADIDYIDYIKEILGEKTENLIARTEQYIGNVYTDSFRPEPGFTSGESISTVKAVIAGIYGGRWYSSPAGVYYTNSKKRNSILKKSDYMNVKKNPVSLMLPKCLTLSRAPFFVATAMAMDAEKILPPFPPAGRNQDGIWGTVMLALNQKAFISHIPFAIYHEINNKKYFTDKDYEDTSAGFGIMTVLIAEYLKRNLLFFIREINYKTLGRQFTALSDIPDKDFISFCHNLWLEYTGNSIGKLENLLASFNRKPKHWAEDADKYMKLLEKQAAIPENSLPRELRENHQAEETVRIYKNFLRDYGELLTSWPAIWEAAFKLNTEGIN